MPAMSSAIRDRLNAALSRLTSAGSAWRARAVDSCTSGTITTNARLTSSGSRTTWTPPFTTAAATKPPTIDAAALSGWPSIAVATDERILGAGGRRGGDRQRGGGAEPAGDRDVGADGDGQAVGPGHVDGHPGGQMGRVVGQALSLAHRPDDQLRGRLHVDHHVAVQGEGERVEPGAEIGRRRWYTGSHVTNVLPGPAGRAGSARRAGLLTHPAAAVDQPAPTRRPSLAVEQPCTAATTPTAQGRSGQPQRDRLELRTDGEQRRTHLGPGGLPGGTAVNRVIEATVCPGQPGSQAPPVTTWRAWARPPQVVVTVPATSPAVATVTGITPAWRRPGGPSVVGPAYLNGSAIGRSSTGIVVVVGGSSASWCCRLGVVVVVGSRWSSWSSWWSCVGAVGGGVGWPRTATRTSTVPVRRSSGRRPAPGRRRPARCSPT